jgi:hypothetical protein
MLPIEQTSSWQKLLTLLAELPPDSRPDLKSCLDRVIELFDREILTQSTDELPDPIAAKMRSYLTESHRLLRLLPIDVMLMEAARSPLNSQQRRQSYQAKLDLLCQYCQAVISIGGD